MNTSSSPTAPPPAPGLCASCRHGRQVHSDRGSQFLLCRLAADDASYSRYPALPVLSCSGHQAVTEERG